MKPWHWVPDQGITQIPLANGWSKVGYAPHRDSYLVVPTWALPLARLWWWWFAEGNRWMIERDEVRRGLLHGPEGGFHWEYKVHPELPRLT